MRSVPPTMVRVLDVDTMNVLRMILVFLITVTMLMIHSNLACRVKFIRFDSCLNMQPPNRNDLDTTYLKIKLLLLIVGSGHK